MNTRDKLNYDKWTGQLIILSYIKYYKAIKRNEPEFCGSPWMHFYNIILFGEKSHRMAFIGVIYRDLWKNTSYIFGYIHMGKHWIYDSGYLKSEGRVMQSQRTEKSQSDPHTYF